MTLIVSVGLPASPLPCRWWLNLTRANRAAIIGIERRGEPTVCPTLHYKGYPKVWLGKRHPYADKSGQALLHRWLMCRREGRKLAPYEHVHHDPDAPKDTLDDGKLAILHAIDHGHYHYGLNMARNRQTGSLEWVDCGTEYTSEELQRVSGELERDDDSY